jgi:spore photoproduct lyase
MAFNPKSIALDPDAADYGLPANMAFNKSPLFERAQPKDILQLTVNKGQAIRSCPGTKEHICCGYQILHVGTGCPLDCSYCILQAYLSDERLRLFVNWDHAATAIEELSRRRPNKLHRLGTGEFTDSLCLDHLTGFSHFIAPLIQATPNMVLEFKTKTSTVENILTIKSADRIIVSFSLNSPLIVEHEEHRAATLSERLEAAQRCRDKGFKLGFHFDPLIHHPGWQEGYAETVDRLFKAIEPEHVIWVSMGCLRFMPKLKEIVKSRFKDSPIMYGEFIKGPDGKFRYFHRIRVEMFKFVESRIRSFGRNVFVYLCMESDGIWKKALDRSPQNSYGLKSWLDRRTIEFFPSLDLQSTKRSSKEL